MLFNTGDPYSDFDAYENYLLKRNENTLREYWEEKEADRIIEEMWLENNIKRRC